MRPEAALPFAGRSHLDQTSSIGHTDIPGAASTVVRVDSGSTVEDVGSSAPYEIVVSLATHQKIGLLSAA